MALSEQEELEYLELLELESMQAAPAPVKEEEVELLEAINTKRLERFPNAGNRIGAFEFGGFHGTEDERQELTKYYDMQDALLQPRQEIDKLKALQGIDPTIQVVDYDKDTDVAYVEWEGNKYPINKAGISMQDIKDVGVELGTEIPLMALGGGVATTIKAGSILARATGVATGAGLSSAFRDITADVEVDVTNAALQSGLAGSLDLAIPAASKALGKYFTGKKAAGIVNKFEIAANKYKAQGLTDHQEVVARSMRDVGIVPSELKWATKRADKYANVYGQDAAQAYLKQAQPIKTKIAAIADKHQSLKTIHEWGTAGAKMVEDTIGTMITAIDKVSPRMAMVMNRYEHNLHTKLLESKDLARNFQTAFRELPEAEQRHLSVMLFNGKIKEIGSFMSKPGNEKLFNSWLPVARRLGSIHDELIATGHKVGKVETFFPRSVKDYKGLAKHMGVDVPESVLERQVKAYEAKVGRSVTEKELGRIIKGDLRMHGEIPIKASTTFKQRTIDEVDEKMLPFYTDAAEQLDTYLHRAISSIEKNRFLGIKDASKSKYTAFDYHKGDMGPEALGGSISDLLAKEIKAGKLTMTDAAKIKPLLQARFGEGEKFAPKWMQRGKNLLYMWTLGHPTSALTQVGDIALSAQVNGLIPTIKATTKILTGKSVATPHKIGLDLISHEFADNLSSARALDGVLKWSGFKAVDRFGKTVHLNASLAKHSKILSPNNPKGLEKFIRDYRGAFTPAELGKVIEDLKGGKLTDLSKYVLWNDLSRAQPIALSQMPKWYLEHPKGRMLYMLKTFTVKQFDLMRREAFQKIARGQVTEGTKNLLTFGLMFTGANAGVDQVKNWIRGKDVDFDDVVIANLYRNLGTSKYVVDKYGDKGAQGVWDAAVDVITPPVSAPLKSLDKVASGIADSDQAIDILTDTAETLPLGGYLTVLKTMFGENNE